MSYTFAKLPRAGLGNMLFVWARAEVFAYLNQIPVFTSSWTQPRLGPTLRREKGKRIYWRYFRKTSSLHRWHQWWSLASFTHVFEPTVEVLSPEENDKKNLYIFSRIPHWSDYFSDIRAHRDYVRNRLWEILVSPYQRMINDSPIPLIAIHVRRGDFRELQPGENFAKVGLVRTPLAYFSELIDSIRELHGTSLPATIFSDGSAQELQELLQKPNVALASSGPDIVDLFLLSKSKLLITSAGSTFSFWAAFLSDAPVLLHPDHIHGAIRPKSGSTVSFEGGVRGPSELWPV